MPYAHISHAPNSTLDDHRAVNADLGGEPPDGLLLSITGADADGLNVIDLWATKEHADRFAEQHLLPAFTHTGKGPDATATYVAFDTDEINVADGFATTATTPDADR